MRKVNKHIIEILPDWVGLRVDQALGKSELVGSRSKAEKLISQGLVFLHEAPVKASLKITALHRVLEVHLPQPEPSGIVPLDVPLDVVFEDSDLIVINKPSGVVVHPAYGHSQDTLVNMLVAHTEDLAMGFDERRPGIVHRLDRDTSGLLVIAKNNYSQAALTELFKARMIHRRYHAVCIGLPKQSSGCIQSAIARHPVHRKKMASLKGPDGKILRDPKNKPEIGKWAITHFEVLESIANEAAYLSLRLETGRTHQIRVHLAEQENPLAADPIYMSDRRQSRLATQRTGRWILDFPRLALHAKELGFSHPKTGKSLLFKVPWPQEILEHLEKIKSSRIMSWATESI